MLLDTFEADARASLAIGGREPLKSPACRDWASRRQAARVHGAWALQHHVACAGVQLLYFTAPLQGVSALWVNPICMHRSFRNPKNTGLLRARMFS